MSDQNITNPSLPEGSPLQRYRVIKGYQASNANPFSITEGEAFQVSTKTYSWDNNAEWIWVWSTDPRGKSGWVPKNIICMEDNGSNATAQCTYSAKELTVVVGEELTGAHLESGWLWATNTQGETGWVPLNCLTLLA